MNFRCLKAEKFRNMDRPHHVVMLAYPDAQILDITGPLEVFGRAGRWLRDNGQTHDLAYTVEITASTAGPFKTSSGIELVAPRAYREISRPDTLLITGGIGYVDAAQDEDLLKWISKEAKRVPRLGSVCTGSLILAKTGILDGRKATTHWAYCGELEKAVKKAKVDPDAIFVRTGNLYTSAGVTSGMDMALAMVEDDWGSSVALAVAQELVLYLKRPGGQSQFSRHLEAQKRNNSRIRDLQLWIFENLRGDLRVEGLAEKAGMSPRTFARVFLKETGVTPAKYVEKIRVEAARRLLEESALSAKSIASQVGFTSENTMRRPFLKLVGITPRDYRARFGRKL